MTTYNHTLVAASLLMAINESSPVIKIVALAGLAASHPIFDYIPHRHWFDMKKIPHDLKNQLGALVEIFGGLLILTWFLSQIFHLNVWWLFAFALSASFFDFLHATGKMSIISNINHRAHFWQESLSESSKKIWELGQTIVLVVLMIAIHQAA